MEIVANVSGSRFPSQKRWLSRWDLQTSGMKNRKMVCGALSERLPSMRWNIPSNGVERLLPD